VFATVLIAVKTVSPKNNCMTPALEKLQSVFDWTFADISQVRGKFAPQLTLHEVGTITKIVIGIAKVSGLPGVGFEELVTFLGGGLGIAFNLAADEIGVVLLGEYSKLHAVDEVERTGRVMDVAVGDGLLGRVIDPLGRPLDGNSAVATNERLPIERPAPPIMDRAPVTVPLQTGQTVVDALIPIGYGQRELILGDRQTGKTAIAMDTILSQRGQNIVCVYCAIGPRASAVANLRDKDAMDYTTASLQVFTDDKHSYLFLYAQFLYAETVANPALEKEADAPPQKMLICFAQAEVTVLGSGLVWFERWIQKAELGSARAICKLMAGCCLTSFLAWRIRIAFARSLVCKLSCLPVRLS
jgi:F-type H+-transporting ATPase subunit alpha